MLRTFGTTYDWIFDSSLDYTPYLDLLQRDGMNLVRTWCFAFPVWHAENMIQPWPRSSSGGNALDGLKKWDLNAWDPAYFDRLKAFAQAASDRGIVVEFTFFSSFFTDEDWEAGPFHPSNNVQGYGPNNRFDCLRPVDGNLFAVQKAAVRRIVRELNGFDNVYFEIQNEPFWNEPGVKDSQDVSFQNAMLAEVRAEEAGLPNRHLVAHNFPQQASAMSADFDIINEHYPIPVPGATIAGAEVLLRDHYSSGKILALDETNTSTELQTRLEVWMFLIGGGAVYNGLDDDEVVYDGSEPFGDNALGNEIRGAVRNAGAYMERLDLVGLRRDLSWVSGGIPSGATLQASGVPGQQYVAYLHHGRKTAGDDFQLHYEPINTGNHSVSLRVSLDAGTWRAVWTRPEDLVEVGSHEFIHSGGNVTLPQVNYRADIALRIDRIDTEDPPPEDDPPEDDPGEDTTPPPAPTGVVAVGNVDSSISVSWTPVQDAGLASYHVYRAESAGVPINAGHRISSLSSSVTDFTDASTTGGVTYFYAVTAIDLSGNESLASLEASATAVPEPPPFPPPPVIGPTAKAGPDQQAFDQNSDGVELVSLDASASEVGDAPISSYEWYEAGTLLANGANPNVSLPVGEHRVRLVVTDANALSSVDELVVRVSPRFFVNGGFEQDFFGWATSGNVTIQSSAPYAPTEGSQLVVFNIGFSEPNGMLTQSFATVPGQDYDLMFDMGVYGTRTKEQFLQVNVTGASSLISQSLQISREGSETIHWAPIHLAFTANSSTTTISFRDDSWYSYNVDLLLDNIRIKADIMRSLVVETSPMQGLDVALAPPDIEGNAGGSTSFSRVYQDATLVSLTAPPAPSGYRFQAWQNDRGDPVTDPVIKVVMDADRTLTAVYSESPPAITSQPVGITVNLGSSATLKVTADSVSQPTYQWRLNGADIPGANAAIHTIASVDSGHAGTYDVVVSNAAGSTTSASAELVVIGLRTLSVESWPMSGLGVTVIPPSLTGETAGSTHFKWVYPDTTAVTLTAPPAPSGYRFLAWQADNADPVTHPVIRVIMDADRTLTAVYAESPPVITSQPSGVAVTMGSSATLQVSASSISPLTYQWRLNGKDIPGANAAIHTIANVNSGHTGAYDVVVSNGVGSTTSSSAELVVIALRTLSVESSPVSGIGVAVIPPDLDGKAGGATSFSRVYPDTTVVALTAPPAPSGYRFQAWQAAGADPVADPVINVTMDADHTLTAVYAENPPAITSQPASVAATMGSSATFEVTADSASPLTYQWRLNGTEIPGANSATFTIASVDSANSGAYDVVVSNAAGSTTSASAELTISTTLLVNGDFEDGFEGWSTSGNLSIQSGWPYIPAEGSRLVMFNGWNRRPNGVLSQSFPTIPGRTYRLTFDMGLHASRRAWQRIQVEVVGSKSLLSENFWISRYNGAFVRWDSIERSFTADSTTSVLTFRDASEWADYSNLLLDRVNIE